MELILNDEDSILSTIRLFRKQLGYEMIELLLTTSNHTSVFFTQPVISYLLIANQSSVSNYIKHIQSIGITINERRYRINQVIKEVRDPFDLLDGFSDTEPVEREDYYKLYSIPEDIDITINFSNDSIDAEILDLGNIDASSEQFQKTIQILRSPEKLQIIKYLISRWSDPDLSNRVQYKDDLPLALVNMENTRYAGVSRPIPLSECRNNPLFEVTYDNKLAYLAIKYRGLKFTLPQKETNSKQFRTDKIDDIFYAILTK